jgi:hypothetical protein
MEKGGRILHCEFCLLREQHLSFGDEVFCMRLSEGGH